MLINGKQIAENIYEKLKKEVSNLKSKPKMVVILVWEKSASLSYIRQKQKWADYVGIDFELIKFEENVKETELLRKIKELNNDQSVNWFIVQLPLPEHINEKKIINNINPKKDIDWFHPKNQWKVLIWDNSWFVPCTPAGIIEILKYQKINLEWKVACVIGKSNIVWKPITSLLINAWATVISCNSKTKNLRKFTTIADIIIIATWVPKMLKVDMIKVWATIIDVWFTVLDGKIYWDADTELIDIAWNNITPVPGWVWALTVCILMKNTVKAYRMQKK